MGRLEIKSNIEQLWNEREIAKEIKFLGRTIEKDYADKDLVIIGILKGCFVFVADLIRQIDLDLNVEFITTASYVGVNSTGTVNLMSDIDSIDIEGKDVLLIDDIIDTGLTMSCVKNAIYKKNPKSIKTCAFISKLDKRKTNIMVDYYCFGMFNNIFVVGYGLDYNGLYRNLPILATYKES